jgi:signal transduction histidine kinase
MSKHFSVDARAMLTWGRESIKDHATAVMELVKNSYDANATTVVVSIQIGLLADDGPHIRISDDGVGMSSDDIEAHWLRLGYSAKRDERFTSRGRRKTGEKGIGRISADRLGAVLELRSQARNAPATGLRVEWKEFEAPGRDLQTVPVTELTALDFQVPRPAKWDEKTKEHGPVPKTVAASASRPGTELLITALRQSWDEQDVQELRRLLSLLTPPFDRVDDFQVRIDNDVDAACNGVVTSPLMASAAIEGRFHLDVSGNVRGKMIHRLRSSKKRVEKPVSVSFDQLVHPKPRRGADTTSHGEMAKRLGDVSARLLFYPQKAETVRGLDLDLADLREFLQANSGVRVYRDNVRVPPYGDAGRPEGDWLALGDRKARNPAGPSRPDFHFSPHQLVGAVFIGRDSNPELIDTSGREGLVTGEALAALKSFLIGCLTKLETHYHELFTAGGKTTREPMPSPRDTVDELRVHLAGLADTIKKAEERLPPAVGRQMTQVVEQLATTTQKLKEAEKSFEELGSQAAISRTLATIGIAAATFGHETQRGLDSMRATLETARLLLRNGENTEDVLSELEKALLESEKVSAWGAFALGRVRRDKRVRRTLDVGSVLGAVLDEIEPAMEASSITLTREFETVKARVFAMDVECIVINLLTNAYYFTKQSSRERRVVVRLRAKQQDGRPGFDIVVADSGPGVPQDARQRVWDPLFTTKTDDSGKAIGTGLGLALINAVVQDAEGIREIDADSRIGGARFRIWLPGAGA